MAQLVKLLTLDFGSCHDLMVHEIEPYTGVHADSEESAWDSLSPSLSLCPSPAHDISHKINIKKDKTSIWRLKTKPNLHPE